jgi:hypothetical protein
MENKDTYFYQDYYKKIQKLDGQLNKHLNVNS